MGDMLLGSIQLYAFNYAPTGWASCDGQTLNIISNQALYSLIGAKFGGDGQTTFATPNLNNANPLLPGNNFMKYYIATEGIYPSRP
jgi:microcystin-dependent protein